MYKIVKLQDTRASETNPTRDVSLLRSVDLNGWYNLENTKRLTQLFHTKNSGQVRGDMYAQPKELVVPLNLQKPIINVLLCIDCM